LKRSGQGLTRADHRRWPKSFFAQAPLMSSTAQPSRAVGAQAAMSWRPISDKRRPGFDQNRLAYFLLDPHPKMPDMGLSRTDAADLAAYISSLGK
jgi:hypothetical protein